MEKEVKKMITRRETLKHIIETKGLCKIFCKECPFSKNNLCTKLKVIGAMALLRMFKKKPLLPVGTKIKFSDGKIATLVKIELGSIDTYYRLDFGSYHKSIDYLVDKTWEFVE